MPASLLSYLLPAGDPHPQPGTTSTRCIAVRPATVRHIGGVIVAGDGGSSAVALGPPEASAPYSNSGNKPHSMALHLPERSPAFLLPGCELYIYLQAERKKGRERKRQFPYLSFHGASYWAKVESRGGPSWGSFANPRQGQLQNLVMRKTTKPDDFSFQAQGEKKNAVPGWFSCFILPRHGSGPLFPFSSARAGSHACSCLYLLARKRRQPAKPLPAIKAGCRQPFPFPNSAFVIYVPV